MAYSTVEDVRSVLVGMRGESENKNANSLDNDQIAYAISNADAQINAVLRKKYVLPLVVPIEPTVHALSVDIAVFLSVLTFRTGREFSSALDVIEVRYARALRLLRNIENGEALLDLPPVSAINDTTTIFNPYDGMLFPPETIFADGINYIPPDPVWSRGYGGYSGYR